MWSGLSAPANCWAIRLASVSPVANSERVDLVAAADHLRHGDRLAERPAQAEERGGGDPGGRRRQHDPADVSQRVAPSAAAPSWSSRGNRQEEVPADRRDDRHDHDRQDDRRREDAASGRLGRPEERDEAEPPCSHGSTCWQERPEHEDPPEAEDHARDRGEHLDERADDPAHRRAARACSGRARSRSPIGVARSRRGSELTAVPKRNDPAPKMVEVRPPRRVGDEAEAEARDRRPGAARRPRRRSPRSRRRRARPRRPSPSRMPSPAVGRAARDSRIALAALTRATLATAGHPRRRLQDGYNAGGFPTPCHIGHRAYLITMPVHTKTSAP